MAAVDRELDRDVDWRQPAVSWSSSSEVAHGRGQQRPRGRLVGGCPNGIQHLLHAVAMQVGSRLKLKLVVV